jgi:cytochrome c oxidase subunit 3
MRTEQSIPHQFEDREQQLEASTMGMWVFLSTEVLFFGGLFFGYTVYRALYHEGFAEGSRHLDIVAGAVNTAVLLCSSLAMALAVHSAQTGQRRKLIMFLIATQIIGALFLGIKFNEYYTHYKEHMVPGIDFTYSGPYSSHVQLFMLFYFIMTGLHAVHMIIGEGMLMVLTLMAARGKFSAEYYNPVDVGGLYWHFIDIVWVFLFPMLYLVERMK